MSDVWTLWGPKRVVWNNYGPRFTADLMCYWYVDDILNFFRHYYRWWILLIMIEETREITFLLCRKITIKKALGKLAWSNKYLTKSKGWLETVGSKTCSVSIENNTKKYRSFLFRNIGQELVIVHPWMHRSCNDAIARPWLW